MSVEENLETYMAAVGMALHDELEQAPGQRLSGAKDEHLQAANALVAQASLDHMEGHLERAELLLAGLVRAADQAWDPASPLAMAVARLRGELEK